jgi:hypothetical protein
MMRPAPDMIGPSWLPLADAIKSEASSVTPWSLPTTQWGAASKLRHFTARISRSI